MKKSVFSLLILGFLNCGYVIAQDVQMQCRPLVPNDFVGPDEVVVNDKVCHVVRPAVVQPATPQASSQGNVSPMPTTAAATAAPEPSVSGTKAPIARATVVLYRPARFIDAARKATVYVDNRPLCELTNNSHFKFVLPVGTHSLTTLFNNQKAGETALPGSQFNLVEGQTYYFTLTSHWLIFPVSPQQGGSEAAKTKPLNSSNIILQPTGNEVN